MLKKAGESEEGKNFFSAFNIPLKKADKKRKIIKGNKIFVNLTVKLYFQGIFVKPKAVILTIKGERIIPIITIKIEKIIYIKKMFEENFLSSFFSLYFKYIGTNAV